MARRLPGCGAWCPCRQRGEDQMQVRSTGIFAGETLPAEQIYPEYCIVGTRAGSLQIRATVNEGECAALDVLAQWADQEVLVAVDSQVAIRRRHQPRSDSPSPHVWSAAPEQRERLVMTWTKSHLTARERLAKFGPGARWAWAANEAADAECWRRSEGAFSQVQADRAFSINKVTRSQMCVARQKVRSHADAR